LDWLSKGGRPCHKLGRTTALGRRDAHDSAHRRSGRDLSDEDVADIIAFLDTLTGSVPEQFVVLPTLPTAPFTE